LPWLEITDDGDTVKKPLFARKSLVLCTILIVVVSMMGLYGFLIEPNQLEIRHIQIENSALSHILKGRVVVQVSDLHIEKSGRRERQVLKSLDDLAPDLIFLTGDYVQWKRGYEEAIAFLSKLNAKIGVWAVMGDYDYSLSRKSCLFCHREGTGNPTDRHSVRFLRNSWERVVLPEGSFWVGGIDGEMRHPFAVPNLSSTSAKEPVIVLSHTPTNIDLLDEKEDVLMLAGDTHGGQVPLPAWLWEVMGYGKNASYSQGFFEKGKKKMFVSKGVGTSHLPIRVLRRPEVVVFHFGEAEGGNPGE
jgi:predicted MPP superfamily phosphohydrolase